MEAIRDAHVKQLASIQEEINALKGKTQSQVMYYQHQVTITHLIH